MKQILIIIFLSVITIGRPGSAQAGGRADHLAKAMRQDTVDPENRPDRTAATQAFEKGYEAFQNEDYDKALPWLHRFLQGSSPDDTDYDWASFFFGISLQKNGFSHAATETLAQVVTRKPNPKIVAYCLEFFEKVIRTRPYDRDLVVNQVICDQSYGFVDAPLLDFIHYYQGIYDWKHGFRQWGDDHFRKIRAGTYYFYQYQYQQALLAIHDDKIDAALNLLEKILESDVPDETFRNQVRKTTARLLYEKGAYQEADRLYGEITQNILEQSQNMLERAWAHYRIGNPEKAMGFLYAFEAPGYANHFSPEYFILKSFIFKDVCHYQRALRVVNEFNERYGKALDNIYQRGKPEDNAPLMLVLLNKTNIHATWRFLEMLEAEKARVAKLTDKPLREYLEKLYVLQMEESANNLRLQIEEAYETMADQLLQYEEEAHLMEYEIGMDMVQRVVESHFREGPSTESKEADHLVVYPFQGEFWNDELADYHVSLPNRCNQTEEWDVYFK